MNVVPVAAQIEAVGQRMGRLLGSWRSSGRSADEPAESGGEAMLSRLQEDGSLDHLLVGVPLTIDDALDIAVFKGRMTEDEAATYRMAYANVFNL